MALDGRMRGWEQSVTTGSSLPLRTFIQLGDQDVHKSLMKHKAEEQGWDSNEVVDDDKRTGTDI